MVSGPDVISRPSPRFRSALGWLRPKSRFDHRNWELATFIALGVALALGATIAVAWAAGFGDVLHRLVHPSLIWIPLALAGQVVAYFGYMLAYREVARVERGPELGMTKLAAVVFTGFGVFVAHGGFSADVVALRNAGISRREARVRVMGLGALEYVLLAPAVCVSALIVLAHRSPIPNLGMTLPWAICVPLGFIAAFWALRYQKRLSQAGGWKGAIGHGLDAVAVVKNLLRDPFKHGHAFFGMGLYWTGEIFSLSAALHAFGSPRPAVAALIIGYATGYALTRRTLPLAGAGVVEALLPFALVWVGASLAPAVLAVFLYRLFNLWLPLIPALGGIRLLRRDHEDRQREVEPELRKAA
jgi:uncharacterized membrane protein YbhN (UPF0104 family)